MTPENKQFLDRHFEHFLVLERAQYIRGLSSHVRSDMQRIISEEFQQGYSTDLWCPTCVSDMVKLLYRNYHDWLKNELGDTNTYIDLSEGIEKMRSALLDREIKTDIDHIEKVRASFPSNK